jgi:hypothetical protein
LLAPDTVTARERIVPAFSARANIRGGLAQLAITWRIMRRYCAGHANQHRHGIGHVRLDSTGAVTGSFGPGSST